MRSIFIGLATAGLLAFALVMLTGIVAGRSPAERAATKLVMPIGALWLLLLAGAATSFSRRHTVTAALLLAAWGFVGVTFNEHVARIALSKVQSVADKDPLSSLQSELDAVVVLGGYASVNRLGVAELQNSGQRLMLTAQLWHAGKTRTIICTGTGIVGMNDPSKIGRDLLVSVGIPKEIIFEVPGVNTAAEMQGLRKFLDDPPEAWLTLIQNQGDNTSTSPPSVSPTLGLVTSSSHMPRALRLASGQELEVLALPCLLPSLPAQIVTPSELIPNTNSGRSFAIAFKEWLAKCVGR